MRSVISCTRFGHSHSLLLLCVVAVRPELSWFRQLYQVLTRSQKANIKQLYIVHPTWYLRSALWIMSSFVSNNFWSRIVYIHRVSARNRVTLASSALLQSSSHSIAH